MLIILFVHPITQYGSDRISGKGKGKHAAEVEPTNVE